ncbi:MAG: rRNA pseudouridine synthase [Clostridia bacterium]|mgnify:CR=1 FL=1|uniref:pseudouridine synthase n=1 Tax=Pumilibacter muris TaxID=2941510 RepID=UPI00203B20F8|nr:pseudouridine synthase [Pumilibacter muris]MCI8595997.1 rRNA pseudouridine synthase [Clostridia bacterium]
MRINKYLAECGLASRRASEQIITAGRVKLNGKIVTDLATDVSEDDFVTVDGKRAQPIHKHIYLMLNKPKGYITSTNDEKGRKTVMDLLDKKFANKRIFPIGRLDYDTEGLLLLTTDGDLCNRISHPRNDISKTYVAKIENEVSEEELNKLRGGVILDGVKTKRCRITVLEFDGKLTRLEVVISEGRNRQVRRMFESINREVVFLKRVGVGELKLGGLGRGECRELKPNEIDYLKKV